MIKLLNSYKMLIPIYFALLHIGCDKVCNKTVQEVVNIQNTTGRQLTLKLCKGRSSGEVQTEISNNSLISEINVGSHQETTVLGGGDIYKSCSDSATKASTWISLSHNSTETVKLCQNQTSEVYIIVDTNQVCPADTIESTLSDSCLN